MRIPFISAIAAGAVALGGCAYGDLGMGMGYGGGYGSYGYGSPYGYGYSSPYYGWYDNYPGTGDYVYNNYRQPYAMSTTQRSYWAARRPAVTTSTTTRTVSPNWSAFNNRRATATADRQARQEARDTRRQARQNTQQPK